MKKKPSAFLPTIIVFTLTVLILSFPSLCLQYALNGLNLWFQKMIPALFPFMVLSGIMIRMNLTDSFVKILSPVLKPLFRVRSSCLYTIVIGFLCGFPMGANVTAQLYERERITKAEAEFLLSFCNNIGPVYFLSFAMPVAGVKNILPAFAGMYGLPLLYGLFLRFTRYRNQLPSHLGTGKAAVCSSVFDCRAASMEETETTTFLQALDESVMASLGGIAKLGGYMILFNMLFVIPVLFCRNETLSAAVCCALEITGGISRIQDKAPFLVLCFLPFGGFSCIAQTYSMIMGTGLSLKKYVFHKLMLTAVSAVFYVFALGMPF